ncbi:MAG TPA: type 1 glutamine amidotransferase domain-containing protein [Cyclobacteriaceae bacterium]
MLTRKIVTLISLIAFGLSAYAQSKKVLIVSTNIDSVGNNASGTYLMEIAHPFKYFIDNGFEVDIVTHKGGKAAIYGKVTDDLSPISTSELFIAKITNTLSPDQVKVKDYSAVFYPGGHGQYFDVMYDERIAAITTTIYEKGGVIGTAGHGVASLVDVRLSNGKYLVDGKKITCFPLWAEKKFMNISVYGKLLAFDMQEVLTRRGANLIVCTPETRPNQEFTHIVDAKNRIVTGAFATSAKWAAEQVVILMRENKKG